MWFPRLSVFPLISLAALSFPHAATAQTNSGNQSWTSSSEQGSPDGAINPTRTTQTHSEGGDRSVDKSSVERLGPDGRYIPYSDTEKESVRVNETTVRTIERTFSRDADGHRTLIQQQQEESRSLPDGAQQVTRILSNPDGNGRLQVIRREVEESKQLSPEVRVTNTTLLLPDINGGFSAAVRTEQKETRGNDGAIESRKSTLITDGTGGWKVSEVRESTSKPEGAEVRSKEEHVLRPDANGKLAEIERTVTRESQDGAGDKRETVDTYSTNVPGVAGENGLQLVQRETTVQRTSSGTQSTMRQVEKTRPGTVGGELRLSDEVIDIVRPNARGTADHSRTILTTDSDGRPSQVWIDTGKTSDPAAIKVDTKEPAKPATKK